jgi:23S rRNA (pseudouridine1915-N3)-methyltransferase
MYKVKILTVGKCKEEWLSLALAEYERRLSGRMSIEWKLAKEDEQLEVLAEEETYIALDPKGKLIEEIELSARMVFVIGSAEGLTEKLKRGAQSLWSLSRLTFTHQMTRLILVEQLYRALEIARGSQYHKA